MPGKKKTRPKPKEIVLTGDLTIANVHHVLEQFKKALADDGCNTITIGEVDGIDLTCLQLICSFHRSVLETGRQITLDDSNSPEFQAFKHAAGLERHHGCCMNPNKNCLWIKETLHE